MKITREQPQFTPITIVIETKDEADFMYGLLDRTNPIMICDYLESNETQWAKIFKSIDKEGKK